MALKRNCCMHLLALFGFFFLATMNTADVQATYDLTFQPMKTLIHGGPLTKEFLKKMADLFEVKVFIETGTNYGYTIDRAREYFKDVYSIEINHHFYHRAVKNFQDYENVHLFCGDSPDVLTDILPTIKEGAFFWLDAHYGDAPVPILREIEVINRYYKGQPILLVDDIRNFRRCSNFPSVEELRNTILKYNDDYEFVLLFDAALAFPRSLGITVSPVLKAHTLSYLSEETEIDEHELLKAENIIALSSGVEMEFILSLYKTYPEIPIYHVWAGLIRLNQACNQAHQALEDFEAAEKIGLNHNRLQRYKNCAGAIISPF